MIKRITLAAALAVSVLHITGCAVARDQQSVGSFIDDTTITTQVKARFADDATVSALAIKVETLKGVVQLAGFTNSPDERARAQDIAQRVNGVNGVINNIIVRP
jgi:hyperosmotically inducible protein